VGICCNSRLQLITGYNQSNCEEKGSVVLIYVLCMMSLVTDDGFAEVISGREQLCISVVVSATVALNQEMNSGRSKVFCTKCRLLSKLKFAKQDKIIHYLYWTMLEPERIFIEYRISLNLGIINWDFSVFSELYISTLKAVLFSLSCSKFGRQF